MLPAGRSVRRLAAAAVSTSCSTSGGGTPGPASRLVPPYPVEDGHFVPILSMLNGFIWKRNWIFRNPQWCDLCREPVAQWTVHQSRKDHALLDQHYSSLVEWPRRWDPRRLLQEMFARQARLHDLPALPMMAFNRCYGLYEKEQRNELYAMLVKLQEVGMLNFGDARHTFLSRMQSGMRGMDGQGALALHELLIGPFAYLYPTAQIQDFSNLIDFITCAYNMETVYDLCGMYTLDKIALRSQFGATSPAALGLGGIATSSSATTGFERKAEPLTAALQPHGAPAPQPASNGYGTGGGSALQRAFLEKSRLKQQEERDGEAFSRKATFVRQVLGQLRWLILPGQVHPAGLTFAPHLLELGEICLYALVAQTVLVRCCEYMVRAEPVWRKFGYERKKLEQRAVAGGGDVVPKLQRHTLWPTASLRDAFYVTGTSALDEEVRQDMRRKGLPVSEGFAEDSSDPPHAIGSGSSSSSSSKDDNGQSSKTTRQKRPS